MVVIIGAVLSGFGLDIGYLAFGVAHNQIFKWEKKSNFHIFSCYLSLLCDFSFLAH